LCAKVRIISICRTNQKDFSYLLIKNHAQKHKIDKYSVKKHTISSKNLAVSILILIFASKKVTIATLNLIE